MTIAGWKGEYCEKCGSIREVEIPATGHTEVKDEAGSSSSSNSKSILYLADPTLKTPSSTKKGKKYTYKIKAYKSKTIKESIKKNKFGQLQIIFDL